MLLEFKVSNFRSIAEEQVFTMLPSISKARTHETGNNYYSDALKIAALYGPNGAGKSSFVKAILYLQRLLIQSGKFSSDHQISMDTHLLDSKLADGPTNMEILFSSKGDVWRYSVSVHKGEISSEILKKRNKKARSTERVIFDREKKYRHEDLKTFDNVLWSQTNRNQLLLSKLDQNNEPHTRNAFWWLKYYLRVIRSIKDFPITPTINFCEKQKTPSKVVHFLQSASIPVETLEISESEVDEKVISMLKTLMEPDELDGEETFKSNEVIFQHKSRDGQKVPIPLEEQSLGTRQLFALAGPILETLNQGFCLIVDELNHAFHTALQKHILDLFVSNETNSNRAQIIFTSHDTNIMNYLERDEIWLCEKLQNGASDYYSLSDIGTVHSGGARRKEAFEKRYLDGRYGGLPDIDFIESAKTIVRSNA